MEPAFFGDWWGHQVVSSDRRRYDFDRLRRVDTQRRRGGSFSRMEIVDMLAVVNPPDRLSRYLSGLGTCAHRYTCASSVGALELVLQEVRDPRAIGAPVSGPVASIAAPAMNTAAMLRHRLRLNPPLAADRHAADVAYGRYVAQVPPEARNGNSFYHYTPLEPQVTPRLLSGLP